MKLVLSTEYEAEINFGSPKRQGTSFKWQEDPESRMIVGPSHLRFLFPVLFSTIVSLAVVLGSKTGFRDLAHFMLSLVRCCEPSIDSLQ